jgi:hypothetical protein
MVGINAADSALRSVLIARDRWPGGAIFSELRTERPLSSDGHTESALGTNEYAAQNPGEIFESAWEDAGISCDIGTAVHTTRLSYRLCVWTDRASLNTLNATTIADARCEVMEAVVLPFLRLTPEDSWRSPSCSCSVSHVPIRMRSPAYSVCVGGDFTIHQRLYARVFGV